LAKVKLTSCSSKGYSPLFPAGNPGIVEEVPKRRDRRKSRRIKDPILVFLYRGRLGSKAARPLDLSLEGIGIETGSPLNKDENLQLAIIIGECQVNAMGRVVYTNKERSGRFRSGIEFEEISKRNRRIIKLYLERMQQTRRSREDEQNP